MELIISSISDSSTISPTSSSSESSSDCHDFRRPKRYKQMFNSDYQKCNVSDLTRARWTKSALESTMHNSDSMSENVSNDGNSPSNPSLESSPIAENPILSPSFFINDANEPDDVGVQNFYSDANSDIQNQNFSENEYEDIQDEDYSSNDESELDSESESGNDEPNERNVLFDRIMFLQSNLLVRNVMVLISAVSLKLGLHDEGKVILGDLVKILAGDEFSDVSFSKYMMSKCVSTQQEHVTSHYYCNICFKSVLFSANVTKAFKNKDVVCSKCKSKQKIHSTSSSSFLSLDLKREIEVLLSNEKLKNDLLKNIIQHRNNPSGDDITDIYDGLIYKNIVKNVRLKDKEYVGTINVSTDGAPLTKSGKKGFWPVQIMLNDLSPRSRFKFILLCGLMLTEKEPESELLNLYISTVFVEQMKKLSATGVDLLTDAREEVKIKFYTHACIVDAIGRRILQNRIQFNGYFGCSWCYQKGIYIQEANGIRYVVSQSSDLRTNNTHKTDVETRAELNVRTFRGVKGNCCLSELPFYDMIWSFPFEYLHGLLLGGALTMWSEMKNGTSEFKISPAQVDFIEKRFLKITPLREIHRLPRSGILKGSAKPKGSELKSWLLCYSLPCLNGILNDEALQHYSILVNNSYKVLTANISRAELLQIESDFLRFLIEYELYYTENQMTFNIHTVRHIVESIKRTGPLIFNSAFPFESNIYHLKKLATGPNGMDKQITRKFLQKQLFMSTNLDDVACNEAVKCFCSRLFSSMRLTAAFRHDVVFCGKGELKHFDQLGIRLTHKKCIYNGSVYTSDKYTQAKKTDDSIVQLKSGEFAKILSIIDNDINCYLQVRLFRLFPDLPFPLVSHIRKIHSEETNNVRMISIDEVENKTLLVNVRNARYVCTLPNTIEIQ